MKHVIYKNLLGYCVTTEQNYYAKIRNERAVQKCYEFESVNEIIDYYCEYFKCNPNDFIIALL